jgi:hypothetical protein
MLTPAMPYLVKGGEKLAEMAAEKLGGAAFDSVKKIWERLRGAIDQSPTAKGAAEDLAEKPEDGDRQAALRVQLHKILSENALLTDQVSELLQQASQETTHYHAEMHGDGAIAQGNHAVAAGKGGVAVGGNVNGGIKLGGGSDKD